MKKTVGIALITLGLASCGTPNYLPCPAYSSTEAIKDCCKKTVQEVYEYEGLVAECENCDEID